MSLQVHQHRLMLFACKHGEDSYCVLAKAESCLYQQVLLLLVVVIYATRYGEANYHCLYQKKIDSLATSKERG